MGETAGGSDPELASIVKAILGQNKNVREASTASTNFSGVASSTPAVAWTSPKGAGFKGAGAKGSANWSAGAWKTPAKGSWNTPSRPAWAAATMKGTMKGKKPSKKW